MLRAAEEKGKSGDVAQYLVGAKLALRFNLEIPVYPANKSDRDQKLDDARGRLKPINPGDVPISIPAIPTIPL